MIVIAWTFVCETARDVTSFTDNTIPQHRQRSTEQLKDWKGKGEKEKKGTINSLERKTKRTRHKKEKNENCWDKKWGSIYRSPLLCHAERIVSGFGKLKALPSSAVEQRATVGHLYVEKEKKKNPKRGGSFHRQPKRRRTKRETQKTKNGKQVYVEWVERGSDCSHHHAGGELETSRSQIWFQCNSMKQNNKLSSWETKSWPRQCKNTKRTRARKKKTENKELLKKLSAKKILLGYFKGVIPLTHTRFRWSSIRKWHGTAPNNRIWIAEKKRNFLETKTEKNKKSVLRRSCATEHVKWENNIGRTGKRPEGKAKQGTQAGRDWFNDWPKLEGRAATKLNRDANSKAQN